MVKLKTKNSLLKKVLAFFLTALMFVTTIPINAYAAGINLGEQDNNANISISVTTHYGHELHTTTVNGQEYPLFCIEYGKSSPSSSTLASQGVPSDANVLEAARWIFAGYYMEHGNDIDWLDMAYCQRKVWSILGSNTSWTFSGEGYNAWCENAQRNMARLNTYPSFDGSNIGNFLAGGTYRIPDTNGVLQDYPAFTQDNNDGLVILHEANSNEIIITINKSCTLTKFSLNSIGLYKTITGQDNECLLYNPKAGGTQKLLYSAYYDPIGLDFRGEIIPLGKAEITKNDDFGAIVDGAEFGLYYDSNCKNLVATATSKDGKAQFNDLRPGTYYVKEISVPHGYLLNTTVMNVVVKSAETATGTVINKEPKGNITIEKRLDTTKTNGRYGDVKIEEATYTLKAAEKITSVANSKTFYEQGDIVASKTIKSNGDGTVGTAEFTDLPLGKYIVVETKEPTGTFIDTKEYEVNLTYENPTTPIIISDDTFSIDLVKSMKVKLFKAGTGGSAGEMIGLKDAEFTIKLNADYEKALAEGYSYAEIWAKKDNNGNWQGLDVFGNSVTVDATRAEKANKIAPNYAVIITDENGYAIADYLPYGKYIVKETVTPIDYISGADFKFSITQDETEVAVENKVKNLNVNNTPYTAPIKIVKKDADSDKTVTLSSATFKIKATENIYDTGSGKLIFEKGSFVEYKLGTNKYNEFMTNSDGYVVPSVGNIYATTNDEKGTVTTPFKLPAGNYEIVEITNPKGFLLAESPVAFTVTSIYDYDKDADGDTVVTVIVKNEQPKGKIEINKSFAIRENMDKTLIEDIDYTKVGFELKTAKEIIDMADGSKVYDANEVIGTYYLNEDATLTIEDLWMGDYTFKEISTIDGGVLEDTVYEVSFEAKDNTTKVYTSTFNIENFTTEVDLSKTDITNEPEIEGAELTVTDSEGNVIDSWVSTTESHKIEGLVVGKTYTLREDYAPDGYVIANEITFTVQNTKDIQIVKMVDKQVAINKVDVKGKPIIGAELVVTSTRTKQIVDKWVTTKENHFVSNLIEGETYILTETVTPDNYVTATPLEFTVSLDKEIQYISMIDKQLEISKTDITTGEELEGAELTVTDEEGNVIDSWISTKTPHIVTGLVEGGKYILTEKTAPYGYSVTESIEFTVTTDKDIQKVVMKDAPILSSIKVNKVDSITKQNIKSNKFAFTLYADAECTKEIITVNANTEDGTAIFEDLRFGTYYIKETQAPKGYELSDEVVEIVINDEGVFANGIKIEELEDGIYSIEYQNSLLPMVYTGDTNRTGMYITMAALLIVGIIVLILIDKHSKKKNK